MVTIKSHKEIEFMKDVCKIVAEFYEQLEKKIRPGISTYELDKEAEKIMRNLGAIPAQIGYNPGIKGIPPYPSATCISINDEVIHGIPSKNHIIQEGDIVSIDTVALKNGFHGDAARTFLVGNVDKEAKRLVDITKQAFFEGIKYAKPGYRIGDISHAVGEFVKSNGYSVVREFQGHGIGKQMHEEPGIPNYGKAGKGMRLEPGMTICVEPMVIQGKPDICELEDGWTILTCDGSLSAHYENTILITENEPKILTIK
jgi:methionyl aminopeptidase